jgi:restriction endonuclease S subunit
MNIVSVESIADLIRGVTFKSEQKLHNDGDGLVPCLRTANIQSQIEYDDLWFIAKTLVKNNKQFLIPGDIIFSAANSKELVGKSAMFRGSKKSITFGAFLTVIRPKQELILPKYLCYYLNSAGALDELRRMASITTNIANISNAKVSVLPVPLPCIIDQKKIVAKIDSLFADIDAGLEKINEVKAKLDSIKQSILKQAFDGTLIDAMKYPQIQLGKITNPINGRTFKSSEWAQSGLPIIRIQNLKNEEKAFNYFAGFIDAKYKVNKGDLLFAWSGTPGTSFGAFIWDGPSGVLNQHIFKLPIDASKIDKNYLCNVLNYKVTGFIEKAQGGVGLAHITKSSFIETCIPLPNKNIQEKISKKIDSLFVDIDNQFKKINQLEQQLNSLKQSILKQAFEGNLV